MDRVAVFVDAGYLFAAGSEAIAGTKLQRGDMRLDVDGAVNFLKAWAQDHTSLPLLRIYWYDGTSDGPTAVHNALAYANDVKVRLGIVNQFGQQKGVDSLIVTDMINLARNRAMASAILLTGDEDLRVGVQQAQEHGARVHLLGIEPCRQSQSNLLLQEADVTAGLTAAQLHTFLTRVETLPEPAIAIDPSATTEQVIDAVAKAIANGLSPAISGPLVTAFLAGEHRVPRDVDRLLLTSLEQKLGSRPDEAAKRRAREVFRDCILSTSGASPTPAA